MASSDANLVRSARNNAPDAWDTLLKRHQLPLYAYAAELLRDRTAALDVVQETFVAAVRNIASLREDARFAAWLFSIAHQKCVQRWRQLGRESLIVERAEGTDCTERADPDAPDPRDALLRREQAEDYFRLLDNLPDAQRATFLLHVLEDFSLAEIATITGVPVGTVKSRLFHAKRALRQLVEAMR